MQVKNQSNKRRRDFSIEVYGLPGAHRGALLRNRQEKKPRYAGEDILELAPPVDETRELEPTPQQPSLLAAILQEGRCVHDIPMYSAEHLGDCFVCSVTAMIGNARPEDFPRPRTGREAYFTPEDWAYLDSLIYQEPGEETLTEPTPEVLWGFSDVWTGEASSWNDEWPFYGTEVAPWELNTSDAERDDFALCEEKTAEDDAYAGGCVTTVEDWCEFAREAADYSVFVPKRRHTIG